MQERIRGSGGGRSRSFWVEAALFIALALVVILVLEITGTTHIFT
jgi:hypothetical protein